MSYNTIYREIKATNLGIPKSSPGPGESLRSSATTGNGAMLSKGLLIGGENDWWTPLPFMIGLDPPRAAAGLVTGKPTRSGVRLVDRAS